MSDVLMVGCDLHDRTMMLKSCVGRDGAVRTRTVPNDRGSRRILMELLKSEAVAAGTEKIVFAYEASGQGFGLYDQLREGGIECHVLAPTKMAKTPGERKRKTDDRDAEKILDLVRASVLAGTSLPTVWVPGWQTRDDREVVRQRVTVADKRCKLKSQVQSLLKRCDLREPVEVKASWEIGHEFAQPAMKSLSELRSEEVATPADQSPRLTTIIRLPSGVQQPPPLWRA